MKTIIRKQTGDETGVGSNGYTEVDGVVRTRRSRYRTGHWLHWYDRRRYGRVLH